jgi:hypothetical protein
MIDRGIDRAVMIAFAQEKIDYVASVGALGLLGRALARTLLRCGLFQLDAPR